MATYMLGNPNALFGSPMMPRPTATPMMPAPTARPAAPTSAANLQALLALSGQDRANAFLKGLGAMGPALIAAGAPSTDPGAAQKNIALAGQLRAKATQDDLARQRAANLQMLTTQMALQKAGRDQAAFNRAEQQRQRLMTLAETAASQAEEAGNQTRADMIRANPTAFIESEYKKQLEAAKAGARDLTSDIKNYNFAKKDFVNRGGDPEKFVSFPNYQKIIAMASAANPQVFVPPPSAGTMTPPSRVRLQVAPDKRPSTVPVPLRGDGSQEKQIGKIIALPGSERAEAPTEAEKKVDEKFAEDYNETFVRGGIADASKQITQLAEVKQRLETEQGLTGPLIGLIPEAARPFVVPEAAAAQDAVEEVVQRNLRLILGAQFTAEEGKRLIARAYNPVLDQKENAKRLGRLLESMQSALTQKLNAYKYYEENRTLRGYKGASKFSVDDIIKAAELDAAPRRTPSITIRRKQ